MIGVDHDISSPTFNMSFCTQSNLLLWLLYSISDSSAIFCILLFCLLFFWYSSFQAITFVFKSTQLPQISSALPRDKNPRSEGFIPPIGAVLQTQKIHESSELSHRCPYNRLHRDHCRRSPLESTSSLITIVTVYGRCSSGRFHRHACQMEEDGCIRPC